MPETAYWKALRQRDSVYCDRHIKHYFPLLNHYSKGAFYLFDPLYYIDVESFVDNIVGTCHFIALHWDN